MLITFRVKQVVNLLFSFIVQSSLFFLLLLLPHCWIYLRFIQFVTQKLTAMSAAKKSKLRDNFKSRGLQVFWGLSVAMTEQYVYFAMKMSLAVPQGLNVISKPNAKNF